MIINITSRHADIKDEFKKRVEKKLSKLDRFFCNDVIADVMVTNEKEDERERVEITIKSNGMVYRGERITPDMFDSLESAVDAIVKQIVKNKTKLERKLRSNNFVPQFNENEEAMTEASNDENYKIVKHKLYTSKPMLPEEAILQMNMINHDFFIFIDAETGKVSIVYKRKKGDYGLIIPEEE